MDIGMCRCGRGGVWAGLWGERVFGCRPHGTFPLSSATSFMVYGLCLFRLRVPHPMLLASLSAFVPLLDFLDTSYSASAFRIISSPVSCIAYTS